MATKLISDSAGGEDDAASLVAAVWSVAFSKVGLKNPVKRNLKTPERGAEAF